METLPRASYGFFSDYTKSLRLWFKTGYKSELKGIEIGKMNKIIFRLVLQTFNNNKNEK